MMDHIPLDRLGQLLSVLFDSEGAQLVATRLVHEQGLLQEGAIGAFLFGVSSKAEFRLLGGYGQSQIAELDDQSIWAKTWISQGFREKVPFIHGLDGASPETLIAVPMLRSGIPVGILVIQYPGNQAIDLDGWSFKALALLGGYWRFWEETNQRRREISTSGRQAVEELTSRQKHILQLIADGLTNAQIAQVVLLSESTVRQETIRIYRLLEVPSRQEAMLKGKALGLVS
jgi:DNA-binding CsgD family transcriptional regulator